MKKTKNTDFIEFTLMDEPVSSGTLVETPAPTQTVATLKPSTTLEDMPPTFRELAQPKFPSLDVHNRARLLMQSPNRLFFYWTLGSNPFQRLNKALGTQTANYTLVLKLVDINRESEKLFPVESEGTWWFDVEADAEYRAEIGFYSPNRPYVRALFSNTVATPRKSPSTRVDTEQDWSISADRFARVLEVAGFTQDAFDVAIAGDDHESAEAATYAAYEDLLDEPNIDFEGIADDEMRHALLLLASGAALDAMRWRISPALFAILQKRAELLSAENALRVLKDRFEVEADEITEEEFGPAVFGSSVVHFPKRLRTRRVLPKFESITSPSSGSHLR